jgi:ferritin-like metal-binding protein YciE
MSTHDLKDAFIAEMRDMLGAEKQINKALKKMSRKASNADLKAAFEEHLKQTEGQVERLMSALEAAGLKARAKHCPGIAGIIEEGEEVIEQADSPEVLDAMLIAAAQKVEHYEIATYGTLCTWGEQLGLSEPVELLKKTLQQEKATDEKLTKLAKKLNLQAQPA